MIGRYFLSLSIMNYHEHQTLAWAVILIFSSCYKYVTLIILQHKIGWSVYMANQATIRQTYPSSTKVPFKHHYILQQAIEERKTKLLSECRDVRFRATRWHVCILPIVQLLSMSSMPLNSKTESIKRPALINTSCFML